MPNEFLRPDFEKIFRISELFQLFCGKGTLDLRVRPSQTAWNPLSVGNAGGGAGTRGEVARFPRSGLDINT